LVDMTNDQWRQIRALRAVPPGLAGSPDQMERRHVLQSSLAQAEELWAAAEVAGPRSRALPLFYTLSQASRAICAAWSQAEKWQPDSHGLKRPSRTPPADVTEYACQQTTDAKGSFRMLAAATASPGFRGTATVAKLWASIPGFPAPATFIGALPRCEYLHPTPDVTLGPTIKTYTRPTQAVIYGDGATVAERLRPFAIADNCKVVGAEATTAGATALHGVIVAFPDAHGQPRPLWDIADRAPRGSEPLFMTPYVLRPPIGTGRDQPPTQLLTLWALLFNLSELTRYYPALWVAALDPDESPIAVTLEHGLDLALAMAPGLINKALQTGPVELRISQADPPDDGDTAA
jgi:hypothetical protein